MFLHHRESLHQFHQSCVGIKRSRKVNGIILCRILHTPQCLDAHPCRIICIFHFQDTVRGCGRVLIEEFRQVHGLRHLSTVGCTYDVIWYRLHHCLLRGKHWQVILLAITHISRNSNDFAIEICPFFLHIEMEIHTDGLASLHSKSLFHRQHHCISLGVYQAHSHSTIQCLLALVDDRRCHNSVVAPTDETWHVGTQHEVLSCHRLCFQHAIIHFLRMGKTHELPFRQRFRQRELNIHMPLRV